MKQRFKKHSFFPQQVVLLLVLVLLFTEQSFAQLLKTPSLSPDKHITQFSIDIWDTEQGLPSRALLYLEQTSDGYIWISSYQGIFRFDGINFEVFDTENTSGVLKTNAARDARRFLSDFAPKKGKSGDSSYTVIIFRLQIAKFKATIDRLRRFFTAFVKVTQVQDK